MARRRHWLRNLGLAFLAVLVILGTIVWRFAVRTETVRLDEHAWAVMNGGGNTLVLDSPEGALVVDTKLFLSARSLQKEVAQLTGRPVKMVVNTHYHLDHAGGNVRHVGAEFVGHPKTREHLLATEPDTYGVGKEGERALTATLVPDRKQFQFGDDFVDIRYLGQGHTDGDVVVFLHKRSLLHAGDLFFNGYYPTIDPGGSGSMRAWVGTLDQALAIGAAKIIPGHGPIATNADMKNARDYLAALWAAALEGARAGKSCDDLKSSFDPKPFHLRPIPLISSFAKNVKTACAEAKAFVATPK